MIDERFLEELLDFANMYIWVLERQKIGDKWEFVYKYLSRGVERFIPIKREELFDKPSIWIKYVHPEDRYILSNTLSIISKEKSVHEVYRIIDREGKIKWVESMVYPILGKDGKLLGLKGYTIDISEKVEKEEKIKKTNKYLYTLAHIGLLFLESNNVEDTVDEVLRILGEATGADRVYWFEAYHKEDDTYVAQKGEWVREGISPQIDNPKLKALPEKRESSERYKILSQGGVYIGYTKDLEDLEYKQLLEEQDIKSILIASMYVNNRYLGFFGFDSVKEERIWEEEEVSLLKTTAEMFGNLLLRVRKEKELKTLNLQFDTLMKSMPVLVAFRDKDGRWIYANPLAEEYLNLKGKDYKGKTTREISNISENEELSKVYCIGDIYDKRVIREKKTLDYPLTYNKKGKKVYLHIKKTPIFNENGDLEGILVIGIDITKEKLRELEREQIKKKMTQMQKFESLGLMASGIAHDFNNILTAISGNISLIQGVCADSSQIKKYIGRITDAIDRAKSLIQNMFTYSGKLNTKKQILDLSKEIEKIHAFIGAAIPKHIKVELIPSEKPIHIYFDSSQLQQIIMNLIINAKEAIGEKNGVIEVLVDKIFLDRENIGKISHPMSIKEGNYAMIQVKDNGPGIPPDILSNIFDPFFSTKSTGKGLGLSIIAGIIKGMNGGINIITEEGRGTIFQIFLPILEKQEDIDLPLREEINEKRTNEEKVLKVLIADDEKWVRDMLSDVLSMLGYTPYSVESGQKAIESIEKEPESFDLIILDYSMPGINGIETMKKIKDIRPDIPIILSSGYVDKKITEEAERLGVAFIHKPYRIDKLDKLIKTLI